MRTIVGIAAMGLMATACTVGTASQVASAPEQQSFQVGAFDSIELAAPHDVVVTVGGQPTVRAEGDADMIQRLEVQVDGSRLKIGTRSGISWTSSSGRVTVYVTTPSLQAAEVTGSGDMRVGALRTPRFGGRLTGSGSLTVEALQADAAEFRLTGSGDLQAAGRARQTSLNIAGSGNAALAGLQAETASISVAGSGNAELRATGTASVAVRGSGNVVVTGGAQCAVSRRGSGVVRGG